MNAGLSSREADSRRVFARAGVCVRSLRHAAECCSLGGPFQISLKRCNYVTVACCVCLAGFTICQHVLFPEQADEHSVVAFHASIVFAAKVAEHPLVDSLGESSAPQGSTRRSCGIDYHYTHGIHSAFVLCCIPHTVATATDSASNRLSRSWLTYRKPVSDPAR